MKRIFLTIALLFSSMPVYTQENGDWLTSPILPDLFQDRTQTKASALQPGRVALTVREIDTLILGGQGGDLEFPSINAYTGNTDTPLQFRRVNLFAESSRIWVAGETLEPYQNPRPRHYYIAGNTDTGVGLAVDPVTGTVSGFASKQGVNFEISGDFIGELEFRYLDEAEPNSSSCSTELKDQPIEVLQQLAEPSFTSDSASAAGETITYQAVVAVDTDSEWLDQFNDNEADALQWITDAFLAMNVFYERDVETHLLIGDVILRTGADPYTVASDRFGQLNEFGTYWKNNMGSIDREFATMFSGRAISGGSFSGIAWINQYCDYGHSNGGSQVAGSYSYNAIGSSRTPGNTANFIGHELGHNMGSSHTHCYSQPVDRCYNGESGCYSGTPQCPASGKGTIMSYCHVGGSNGAGCGSTADFHPTVQSLLESYLSNQMAAGCIAPYSEPNPLPEYASNPIAGSTLNFGNQQTGTESSNSAIQVTNQGDASLLISSCNLSGGGASSFNVNACPSTISPAASANVQVSCEPTSAGSKNATLTVNSNDSDESSVNYSLSCNGTLPPAPEFQSSPAAGSTIGFGSQQAGTESDDSVIVVTNTGNADLLIVSCNLSGANASSFNVNACPSPIAPSGNDDVRVSCEPASVGQKTALLTLTTNDSDESSVNFTLSCTGQAPPAPEFDSAPVEDSTIDFGNQVVELVSQNAAIEVSNSGTMTLLLTACDLSGPDASAFNVDVCPASVPASSAADILVNCEPASLGPKSALLTVHSNDADESSVSFSLSCVGVLSPEDDEIFSGGFETGL